jgi:hypothetical protein
MTLQDSLGRRDKDDNFLGLLREFFDGSVEEDNMPGGIPTQEIPVTGHGSYTIWPVTTGAAGNGPAWFNVCNDTDGADYALRIFGNKGAQSDGAGLVQDRGAADAEVGSTGVDPVAGRHGMPVGNADSGCLWRRCLRRAFDVRCGVRLLGSPVGGVQPDSGRYTRGAPYR